MSPSTKRLSTFLSVCLMLLGTILPSFVRATPTGSYFDTVVIVAMENQNYADVMGTGTGNANAPFISSLLPLGATIPSYNGYGATGRTYTGCSAACYVALTAGSTYGISDG